MKIGLKTALLFGFGVALLQLNAAEDKPAATNAPAAPPKPSPQEQKQNISYSIGMSIGNNVKRGGVDLDIDVLAGAIKDVLAERPLKLTDQQAREALGVYQQESKTKYEQKQRESADKNKKDGAAFLAENKKKPGIKTHEVKLADGTTAEMQYKVITEGTGAMPKSNDTVTVNYRGTLVNGKEFDSSTKHGDKPAKFQVNRVVRGWTEALQMMKAGSKWEVYIPSALAYGDKGNPSIEPGSTLIFEVELVGADAPAPPPPPAQPLTSDIIRVPSAEELKKGAKIEVIKAEDLEKLTNSAANKKPEK
jgi:FKBP-type peptidyl-prolyl cis-trans isomerase